MKVLDLHCARDHVFEGWFASEEDFQSQQQRGLVQCPLCGSSEVRKGLSAPRLNLGAAAPAAPVAAASQHDAGITALPSASSTGQASAQAMEAAWLALARRIVEKTEDVGARFATEARRMHHGETPERPIRGQASAGEAVQLLEEGIAVFALPLPDAAKETLQ